MTPYRPPLADIGFCLEEFADLPGLMALPDFAELSPDLVSAILAEGGKLAAEWRELFARHSDRFLLGFGTSKIFLNNARITSKKTLGPMREAVEIVRGVNAEGTAVIWIEHVVRALTAVVNRLLCLSGGRFVGDGTPAEVLATPAVREVFLGSDVTASLTGGTLDEGLIQEDSQ